MNEFGWPDFWDWAPKFTDLGTLGALASLVSVIITLTIFFKLRNINRVLVLKARTRGWYKTMQEHHGELAPLLKDEHTNRGDIRTVIAACKPTVRALRKCQPFGSDRWRRLKAIEFRFSGYMGRWLAAIIFGSPSESLARQIYYDLVETTQSLKEDLEQAKVYQA